MSEKGTRLGSLSSGSVTLAVENGSWIVSKTAGALTLEATGSFTPDWSALSVGNGAIPDAVFLKESAAVVSPRKWRWSAAAEIEDGTRTILIEQDSKPTVFPAIDRLKSLAAKVKAVLPASRVSYEADWLEYGGYVPFNHEGLYFPLDALWADSNIDDVSIAWSAPMSDWREGSHLDEALASSVYDQTYLAANVKGGEGGEWYYKSEEDRRAQVRTSIADPTGGDRVALQPKLIQEYFSRQHTPKPAWRNAAVTGWTANAKKVSITAFGCNAVDKGTNAPRGVTLNPPSGILLPPFSSGRRDDNVQKSAIEAQLAHWDALPSSFFSGILALDYWDARPFPVFPNQAELGLDSYTWAISRSLNGRSIWTDLSDLLSEIFPGLEIEVLSKSDLSQIYGLVVTSLTSSRAIVGPILRAMNMGAAESTGKLRVFPFWRKADLTIPSHALVDVSDSKFSIKRMKDISLPQSVNVGFYDPMKRYAQSSVEARRITGNSDTKESLNLPIAITEDAAREVAETYLAEKWQGREEVSFSLPLSYIALEVGDVLSVLLGERERQIRVTSISHGDDLQVRGETISSAAVPPAYHPLYGVDLESDVGAQGDVSAFILDLPRIADTAHDFTVYAACSGLPYPRPMRIYNSPTFTNFQSVIPVPAPALLGSLATPLMAGPLYVWDRANSLVVQLSRDSEVLSDEAENVLNGTNVLILETSPNNWEVIQFQTAELIDDRLYRLSNLLRGVYGSESEMVNRAGVGSRVLFLDASLESFIFTNEERNLPLNWLAAFGDLDAPNAVAFSQAVTCKGLRPLVPHALSYELKANGDVAVSWIRQSRILGRSWEESETPLGESFERYSVDVVRPDGRVVRTLESIRPTVLWTKAAQSADFPAGIPERLLITAQQLSSTYGRGARGVVKWRNSTTAEEQSETLRNLHYGG